MTSYPVRMDDDARFMRVIGWIFLAITVPLSLWVTGADWFTQVSLGPNAA